MKRTPVLIDVNGVPLRESLSYNGGGANGRVVATLAECRCGPAARVASGECPCR